MTSDMQKTSRLSIHDALDKNLYGYAAELAKAHLDLYTDDGIAWIELARAFTALSRFGEAEEAFENAYEYAHETLREIIFTRWAEMHKRQGHYAGAEECYRKAIALNPNDANKYVYLGILFFQRGDIALAEETYRQGTNCTEGSVDECYANLGSVCVAQERYEEALKYFEKAIEMDPQYKWAKLRHCDVQEILKFKIRFD